MVGPPESRNRKLYCEFHGDKGHDTNDCIHLRKQIEEAVKSGHLSHLVKEIKQGTQKGQGGKNTKKHEPAAKGKGATIFMIQQWQRNTRSREYECQLPQLNITFPPLPAEDMEDCPMIVYAEIGGHDIHRMYVDGGSASEILYEHCFNKLKP